MSVVSPRRYYLLKSRAAASRGDDGFAAAWKARQRALSWPDLPAWFPCRSRLVAAGYEAIRDLDGADSDELVSIGLSLRDANRIVALMEQPQMTMIPLETVTYLRQDGRTAVEYNIPFLTSAARTTSGTSGVAEMGDLSTLRVDLEVTDVSGTTPTLDLVVQTSEDGENDWQTLATFGQKDDECTDRLTFSGADRFVRVSYTLGGTTPSFEFSVTARAC